MIFIIEYFIFKLGCSNSEKSAKIRRKQQTYTHVVKSTCRVRETKHFPVVESKATAGVTAGKQYWYARHDVTGSDLPSLPPYYSLAVPYLKGQMQRNLDNFSFLEKPSWKSQLYQQEAESTLKNKFCANCSAQDTKIRRFPRASRKRTRNGRAWSGNEIIGFVTSYLASSFSRPNR